LQNSPLQGAPSAAALVAVAASAADAITAINRERVFIISATPSEVSRGFHPGLGFWGWVSGFTTQDRKDLVQRDVDGPDNNCHPNANSIESC
jgi:hypothetical protein